MPAEYRQLSNLFKILAHPLRLQILAMLSQGEECVCHMQAALGKPQPYISQQMAVLRDAGLVKDRKDGLNVFYSLKDAQVAHLLDAAFVERDGLSLAIRRGAIRGCPCPKCRAGRA
jgi:ArsR family transcriptional regulator